MDDVTTRNASELPRIRFLENELDVCETFLNIAAVDADDPAAALAARSKAEVGYDVVLTWITSIRNTNERDRLMKKLFGLRKRLDDLNVI